MITQEVVHRTIVYRKLQREVKVILETDLSTNTEVEIGFVITSPETEVCTRTHKPVETSNDVPTPVVNTSEVKIAVVTIRITPAIPTEVQLNAVEVGKATKMKRNFSTPSVSTAETETDGVLFAVTLCHSCCAKSENSNQCNDKFFHSLFLCY